MRVLDPGFMVSIQDGLGRRGYRAFGVPQSGALDAHLLAAANALINNRRDAAGLEIMLCGPQLEVVGAPVSVAVAGDVSVQIETADGRRLAGEPWRGQRLAPGSRIRIGALRAGCGVAYLAVSGGVMVAPSLGSPSAYPRARLGGMDGRALAAGDQLPCQMAGSLPVKRASLPWRCADAAAIRVILGPQDDHFTPAALHDFLHTAFQVTQERDRMGMRLAGAKLQHNGRGADIASDGATPGAIQVPGNGQPIILLADSQASGGYAKIATVIRADLARLAHRVAGGSIRFAAVDHAAAAAAWAQNQQQFDAWAAGLSAAAHDDENAWQALLNSGISAGAAVRGDEASTIFSA